MGKIVAESLATQLYNTSGPFFEGDMAVSEEMLNVWLNQLCSQPRSSSSFAAKGSSNSVINVLQHTMQRYLSDVKVTHMTADKRDPEFRFYDQTKSVMTAYSVKPAILSLPDRCHRSLHRCGLLRSPAISLSVRPCDQGLQEQNAIVQKRRLFFLIIKNET